MSRAVYCKCKNTYCISCCKDCNAPDYWKQGIGNITSAATPPAGNYGYKVQRCGHNTQKHVHGTQELTIGSVYYFDLVHQGLSNCYTVLSQDNQTSGFLWNSVTSYSDCTACQNANP